MKVGVVLIALVSLVAGSAASGAPLTLEEDDVVGFVGGGDLVWIQQDGRLEAALTEANRAAIPRFRDLAWEGDTVYFQNAVRERWRKEAFGDWREQLDRLGVTVLLLQFGKMESFDGVGRLEEFVSAYGALIDSLSDGKRRVVLLSPLPFAWPAAIERASLPAYRVAIEELARDRELTFVPCRHADPVGGFVQALTGAPVPEDPAFEVLRANVREKHRLWMEYWRPANWKCIFGDDRERIFSKAAHGLPSIQEEWATYPQLVAGVEQAIYEERRWNAPGPPSRTGSSEADIAKELAAFEVLEGFTVNLFADESDGITNPLSVRWDARGRMYVACSDAYPQIEPGVRGYDKVVALRDRDRDGRADESVVFADGLAIPTGMEVGADGLYIGQGPELLTLRDTTGDGVADERRVLLRGFGNGDSHQTSNSFVWSPGGELWWCQGDGIESRVETPFGVSSLFQAGVYRLRPGELRLDPLLDDFMGPGNPWGIAFDDFGQSFVIDGAGGISFLTPASIPAKRRLRLPRIGDPGGYCGIECLSGSTLPEGLRGQFVVGDYKKNQVTRFRTPEDGAGFEVRFEEPLLRSSHRNFRPIDVKMGPDGAIYVVDWYNPITCHQDDFYRHPERDKTHGRIWRIAPKAGVLPVSDLTSLGTGELLEALRSPQRWTRLKAKQVLSLREAAEVTGEARGRIAGLAGRDLMEMVSLHEWIDVPEVALAERLLADPDHRARSYGARVVGRWGARLGQAHELLMVAAADSHPRVRMEALLACAALPDPRSILVAAAVAERPGDRWIDYAFSQAVHHLRPLWLPALRRGDLDFGASRRGLAAVLGTVDSGVLLVEMRAMLESEDTDRETRRGIARMLLTVGNDTDLELVLARLGPEPFVLSTMKSRTRPAFEVEPTLRQALREKDPNARVAALDLVAAWQIHSLHDSVREEAWRTNADEEVRRAAIRTLGALGQPEGLDALRALSDLPGKFQTTAVAALLGASPEEAATRAAALCATLEEDGPMRELLGAFAARDGGGGLLATKLAASSIAPNQARRLGEAWLASGLVDEAIVGALRELSGEAEAGWPYGEQLVKDLVAAGGAGDPRQGRVLFEGARTGCAACHRVGRGGPAIGPDLSAVGSGVPRERIVIEVLWPRRQVKGGYALMKVVKKDGSVVQGYLQESRDEEVVMLREFSGTAMHEIPTAAIARQEAVGSLMPPTAQGLNEGELADLLAYLFSLDGRE